MAVCAGAMIAELGRVATDDRIAPRSENLSSPMTRHRRRALRGHESEGLARPQLERVIALTSPIEWRHAPDVRACRYRFGRSGPSPGRSGSVPNLSMRDDCESQGFH